MPKLSLTTTTFQILGTVERERYPITGELLDSGLWKEEGCQNPIHYFTEQQGMKQQVVFDLALASYDSVGEGPITIVAKLSVTAHGDEPDVTEVESLTIHVAGLTNQDVPEDGSLYERFSSAAIKIARAHFNRLDWDSAYEDQMDEFQISDRAEHKGELVW